MTLRDELQTIIIKPQYNLTIWAIVFTIVVGMGVLGFCRKVIIEIETNSNLIEASSHY